MCFIPSTKNSAFKERKFTFQVKLPLYHWPYLFLFFVIFVAYSNIMLFHVWVNFHILLPLARIPGLECCLLWKAYLSTFSWLLSALYHHVCGTCLFLWTCHADCNTVSYLVCCKFPGDNLLFLIFLRILIFRTKYSVVGRW